MFLVFFGDNTLLIAMTMETKLPQIAFKIKRGENTKISYTLENCRYIFIID